jgi:Holliday junction resolvase RusA-like endonuclease
MRARLPYPPTINHYYGVDPRTHHKYLTHQARSFRKEVWALLVGKEKFGKAKLTMRIDWHQNSKADDIDNRVKPLLDALEHAGTFNNDKQIRDLRVVFSTPLTGGATDIQIWEQT